MTTSRALLVSQVTEQFLCDYRAIWYDILPSHFGTWPFWYDRLHGHFGMTDYRAILV